MHRYRLRALISQAVPETGRVVVARRILARARVTKDMNTIKDGAAEEAVRIISASRQIMKTTAATIIQEVHIAGVKSKPV
jgi:electron transfer flavoprotein alpha/beta subunit